MLRNGIVIALFGMIVAACTPTSTQGVVRGRAASSGPFGLMRTDDITVDTASAFKGQGRVMVGSFLVGFSTYDTATAKLGRNGNAARNTLVGVDTAVMQRVVDDAYSSLVASLKAQGYTVVDRAELAAAPGFAATKSYPNPYEDSSGSLFGTSSRVSYLAPTGFGDTKIFQGDIAGTMGGFASENPLVAAANYAKASGTRVIHAVYVLGFVNATPGMKLTAMVEVGQGVTAKPAATKLGMLADTGGFSASNGTLTLGQPITSDREFATIANTTTGGAIAAEAAVGVLVGLLGGGSSVARDFSFTARPGDYAAAASDALAQVNAGFVAKMVSLR
jgi:hypothetical protein